MVSAEVTARSPPEKRSPLRECGECRHARHSPSFSHGHRQFGVPVKVGMALTAHKTVAMFMRYVHTEDDPVRQAAELVANRRKSVVGAPSEANEIPS